MYIRSALHLQGVSEVADFWTARNLRALARLWAEISEWPHERERQALAFAFTNTAWHATRMRRYNARGGQRPLTGTLYIPQLSIEVNPAPVFAHKIRQLQRFYAEAPRSGPRAHVLRSSATQLPLNSTPAWTTCSPTRRSAPTSSTPTARWSGSPGCATSRPSSKKPSSTVRCGRQPAARRSTPTPR